MIVVQIFLEPSLKKNWHKIHKPKSPPFSCKVAGVFSKVPQNKGTRNILDCIDCFLTNFFPNCGGDDVALFSCIKALRLAHPHINEVLIHIFKEEMHKIPRDTTCIVDRSHALQCWHTFDTKFYSQIFLVFGQSSVGNLQCSICPIFRRLKWEIQWVN